MVKEVRYLELEEGDRFTRDEKGRLIVQHRGQEEELHPNFYTKYVSVNSNANEDERFEITGPFSFVEKDYHREWKIYHPKTRALDVAQL